MSRILPTAATLLLSSLLVSRPAAAQSGNPAPLPPLRNPDPRVAPLQKSIAEGRSPKTAALSPDGALLAWSLNAAHDSTVTVVDLAHPDAEARVITQAACSLARPVWSPDSTTLALEASCTAAGQPEQVQIALWSRSSGQLRQLTHVSGNPQDLVWSPDSKSIAFLFVPNATRKAGALDAMKPWSGVVGEDGVEVQHVALTSARSGETSEITPSTLHVYEFGWSPDSRSLTYTAAPPPGENNYWVAQLYTQPASHGSQPRSVFNPATTDGPLHGLQLANPRFSPDGKRLAFIAGLMSDQGSTGGDIYTLPAAGGSPRDVLPDKSVTPIWFEWAGKANIRYVAHKSGGNQISSFNADTERELPSATELYKQSINAGVGSLSSSRKGEYAFIASSFDAPPEIYLSRGPASQLRQITHLNPGLKPVWGRSESIEWQNEGFHVQGWLLYPAHFDPAKHYPLIVDVHGGPSAMMGSRWGAGGVLFSALDYFVFMPNPRGSFGEGEKFTQANVKDFGYGDLRDILTGMDLLEKKLPIDSTREGLTGWSYGGFMTMFGVTQTTRFRAAVAGAGIANWQSYYGENSIDQWMTPFFGATVYQDPAVYAKSSAIDFISKVKTPTLVLVGDRDGECPAPQSFEFWHALRAAGVKTQLVIYPNEGHGFSDPAHITDRNQRELQWFEQNMPTTSEAASATRP